MVLKMGFKLDGFCTKERRSKEFYNFKNVLFENGYFLYLFYCCYEVIAIALMEVEILLLGSRFFLREKERLPHPYTLQMRVAKSSFFEVEKTTSEQKIKTHSRNSS